MSTPQDPYFSLKWDNFVPNICCFFHDLREEKDFSDVTLACGDQQVEAHKVILAASSPFFSSILKKNQHTHPLIYLKGIKFSILEALLKFIYQGEVTVHQDNLEAFFTAAEELKVKGLTPGKNFDGDSSSNEQPHTGPTSTIALPTTAPALPQYSAQMLGNFQAGAGGTMPVQNNNTDSEMPVKKEPESVQLEDNSNLPGERRPDPESYDHYQTAAEGEEFDFANYLEKIEVKKFKCTICEKTIRGKKSDGMRHVESIHYPGTFVYNCELCGEKFDTKNKLKKHHLRNSPACTDK